MKQVNIVFSLLIITCLLNQASAQEDSKLSKYLPNYSIDDPSALYNGIPNISIPLYSINGKGVTVPVSISYDASGITVAQEATSVGLGWVLNAGGHIIQEVRDWDDCLTNKHRVSDSDSAWALDYSSAYGWRNEYDNLPDNFFYSCNGLSGKFILSEDLTECFVIPQSTTRITRGGAGQPDYTITSEEGVCYNFDLSQIVWKNQNEVESRIYVLESIYTPECDTIDFTYYSAEYTKLVPKTVVDGITGEEFRISESKEMPMNLVSKISLRGGESVEFVLLGDRQDCYSTTDTIPKYELIKLVNRDGTTVKQFDLEYGYFTSDPLMQYLPERKYDIVDVPVNSTWILKGGYHIPFQDTSIYYDSIAICSHVRDSGFQISYIEDGAWSYIENSEAFINGNYLFTWKDGDLFALLNTDYLENSASYPEMGTIEFYCPSWLDSTKCDSMEQADYEEHKAQWEFEMDEYLDAVNEVKQTYYPDTSISSTHYFKIDTAYYFDFMDKYYTTDTSYCYCAWDFRPYYRTKEKTKRLKLESVVELNGFLDTISPPITFEYDTTNLPHYNTNDVDHWGYSNYDGGDPNKSPIPGGNTVFGYSYAQANESAMKAGVLTKINYPYGGYVKYNFEANVARTNATGSTSETVGGLRLKSIENGTGSGEKYYTNYEYKLFKDTIINGIYTLDTTGIPSGNLLAYQTQYEIPVGYEMDNGWQLVMTDVQESVLPLLKTKSGYVGYSEVAASKSDDNGNTLGRTLYRFYPVDTLQYKGVSDIGGRPGANSVKYICPPSYSSLSGSLKEKIVTDKWDQILTKSVHKYAETEPNYLPEPDSFYSNYIHSYTYLLEQSNFVVYLDPNSDYTNSNQYIFPRIPVLSSVHNYSYYPDEGLTSADSVFFLYDTHNSQFYTSGYDYWGFVDAFPLSSSYSAGLDAYLDFDTPGIEEYRFQCGNIHKPIFELGFKPDGSKTLKRYWYPPHLAASDTVYEKMVDRNIISMPVKVETFLDTIRMEGQKTKFAVFSKEGSTSEDFLLPSVREQYFTDQYEPVQEFVSYSDNAALLESEKTEGYRNSSIWRDRGRTQIAVIENSEYDEFLFQDFEEDTVGYGEDWKRYSQSYATQSYSRGIVHTGKKSLKLVAVNSASTSYIAAKKSIADLDADGRYTFSAWIRADTASTSGADVVIYYTTSSGTTQISRSLYDSNKEGEWQKLQVDIDLSDYSGVTEVEARIRNIGTNSVACYVDDISLYPSDALLTTYTYDPLVGRTSEISPSGITTIYEYDDASRLWRIKDDEGNILKQHTYHFAE